METTNEVLDEAGKKSPICDSESPLNKDSSTATVAILILMKDQSIMAKVHVSLANTNVVDTYCPISVAMVARRR